MKIDTGKDDYHWAAEFERRTAAALVQRRGDDAPFDSTPKMRGGHRLWGYDACMNDETLDILNRAAPFLLPLRGYRILDIGCGYGRSAPFLSMFDCKQYVGVDSALARVQYARNRYAADINSFRCGDARTWRGSEPFDVVWCSTVIQHLPRPDKLAVINTIKANLKPTGFALLWEGRILAIVDPEKYYTSEKCPAHMVPISRAEVTEAFLPWEFAHVDAELHKAGPKG